MAERLGYIGLGAMGLPFVRHLAAAGHQVSAYDKDSVALARAEEISGIEARDGPAAVAAASDIVFTCLPHPDAVEEVYADLDRPGLLCIDNSTVGPSLAIDLHRRLAARRMAYVECPMLGGVGEAEAGGLFLLLSGDDADIERALPLVRLACRDYRKVGGPGCASRFKVVQNGLGHVQMVAIAEALALLAKAGADLDQFIEIVSAGHGMADTPLFKARAPMMRERAVPVKGALHIAAKDSGLAAALAKELDLDLPLFARAAAVYVRAMDEGLAHADTAAVAQAIEASTSTRIVRNGS